MAGPRKKGRASGGEIVEKRERARKRKREREGQALREGGSIER